jgi:hypothetical protein
MGGDGLALASSRESLFLLNRMNKISAGRQADRQRDRKKDWVCCCAVSYEDKETQGRRHPLPLEEEEEEDKPPSFSSLQESLFSSRKQKKKQKFIHLTSDTEISDEEEEKQQQQQQAMRTPPHTQQESSKQTKREGEAAPAAARRRRRRQKGKGSWEEEARKPVVVVVGTQESRPQHIAATVRESQRKEHLKTKQTKRGKKQTNKHTERERDLRDHRILLKRSSGGDRQRHRQCVRHAVYR